MMINRNRLSKIVLLAGLYLSQCLLPVFILSAVPVFLRQQGVSLDKIGLLGLLALPLMLKFLWSPLIDRYGYTRWGHYRFWIIVFQSLLIIATGLIAWLDVQHHAIALLILGSLVCFLCASQDIATDALAVGLLEPQERGLGNGIQNAGNYLGTVIGGGGLLLVLDRWGWKTALMAIGVFLSIALIPIVLHSEKVQKPPPHASGSYFRTFVDFYCRPNMGKWLLILISYTLSSAFAGAMFRPLLVDIGLSLSEIGWLIGVVSYGAGTVGALIAGLLIAHVGRKQALILFKSFEAVAILTYLLPALGLTDLPLLYLAAISVQMTSSMASTAMCTIMMDNSRSHVAGTDYTLQSSVLFVSAITASVCSGAIAQAAGYQSVFLISCAIASFSVVVIAKMFNPKVSSASLPGTLT
jgi:MFS family permease